MKHYVATFLCLLITAASHSAINHSHDVAARADPPQDILNIPAVVGTYRQVGEDIEIDERTIEILETSTILMRNYRGPKGWPIQLTIVYAGTTRRSMHFPEVCIVGQGWEIHEQTEMPVGFFFNASRLVLVKGEGKQALLYWFKTADEFTGNFFVNSWHWARSQLTRGTATSAMIKVSAPIGNRDEESVFLLLEDFATKLTPILRERIE